MRVSFGLFEVHLFGSCLMIIVDIYTHTQMSLNYYLSIFNCTLNDILSDYGSVNSVVLASTNDGQ